VDARLLDVRPRERGGLERDDDNGRIEISQSVVVLLQLQQMPSARQSAQVAMKDEQQPMPSVVLEAMRPAVGIAQSEASGRLA